MQKHTKIDTLLYMAQMGERTNLNIEQYKDLDKFRRQILIAESNNVAETKIKSSYNDLKSFYDKFDELTNTFGVGISSEQAYVSDLSRIKQALKEYDPNLDFHTKNSERGR